MPHLCPVCSNEEYDEADGLFFCTECGTQSQELIVQEAALNTDINVRHEVRASKADGQQSSETPKADLGRPWTIYEAYQVIILAQAESLISLGANGELKDVIYTVWANYLSKLGVAFSRKEKIVPDIVMDTKFGRLRELHRGTLINPLNRRKRPFNERHSKFPKTPDVQTDHLSGEEFYEEDRPVSETYDNIIFLDESEDDSGEGTQSSDEDNTGLIRRNQSNHLRALRSPEWMNMKKTIALCYIGLMFTNPDILPCDVIGWIYEGKIPFLSTTHLLPHDMVLSAGDQALFETGRFDTSVFISEINKLMTYLKLKKVPSPRLDDLICRFVKELSLPGEFITFSHRLTKTIPFLWTGVKRCYRKCDVLALSYIVLAVKIVLHLDDSGEWLLAEYSQKMQDLVKPEKRLFVWSEWKKFIMQEYTEKFSAYRNLTSDFTKCKLEYLDQMLKCHAETASDQKKLTTRFTLGQNHRHQVNSYKPEFRSSLRKPLEIALERAEDGDPSQDIGQIREKWMKAKSQEFQDSTISHLLDASVLRQHIGHLSSKKTKHFEQLLKQFPVSKTEITQYELVNKLESLTSQRHDSYLWLLQVASQVIDCSVLLLDKFVVRLTNYMITVSRGEDVSGLMCSIGGNIQTGGTFAAKRLKSVDPQLR